MEVNSVSVYADDFSDCAIAGIDVYASMDGINYDLATSFENNADAIGDTKKFIVSMPGTVYAKDLKVIVTPISGAESYLYEIEAMGKPAQGVRERFTSYRYDDEVPFVTESDILSQDADLAALSDGLSTQVSTTGDYLSVIYDLGGFHQVEDIRVLGNHGGFELLTSPDGYNYFSSAFYANTGGDTTAYGRAENNAKYVKLVFHKPDGSNIFLSEIELYARKLKETTRRDTDVNVRAKLKANNVMFLDWSDHNAYGAQKTYNVYIETKPFTSTAGLTPKGVQVGLSSTTVTDVAANFAVYAGLAPETDYYIAVTEKDSENTVTPIKVTSNDLFGGDNAAAILNVNEYNGGAYIMTQTEIKQRLGQASWGGGWERLKLWEKDGITQEELDAIPENPGVDAKVRKLLGDIESVQKNRDFTFGEGEIRNYVARGISWLPENIGTADALKDLGIYAFGHINEPEITPAYNGNNTAMHNKFGTEFDDVIKAANTSLKAKNQDALLYSPTLCGTDMYKYLVALYANNADMGNHYDVLDAHMYNKSCDPSEEYIEGSEKFDVPERIINKANLLRGILADYNDEKPIVSTEIGWSDSDLTKAHTYIADKVTPEKKAEYVARMYLSGIMAGVEEVYLYAFQDEGYLSNEEVAAGKTYISRVDKGSENKYDDRLTGNAQTYYIARSNPCHEHQFGVVDWYGNPEPGYFSFYTLGKMIRDTYFVEQINLPTTVYGAVFYDKLKDKYLTALWENSGNGTMVNVSSDEDTLTKIDMYGGVSQVTPGIMTLTTAPFYLYSDEPLEVGMKNRQIISGNGYGVTNNIASTYAKYGQNVTISGNIATYTATNMPSDSDPNTLFKQGKLGQTYASGQAIWSNYGSRTTEVVVDLGKNFMVDGADAAAFAENSAQQFTKIKVEVSTDGTNYNVVVPETTLVDGVNSFITATNGNQIERLSINSFTPVNARYVKVTMTGGTYQVVPNEVMIFGK